MVKSSLLGIQQVVKSSLLNIQQVPYHLDMEVAVQVPTELPLVALFPQIVRRARKDIPVAAFLRQNCHRLVAVPCSCTRLDATPCLCSESRRRSQRCTPNPSSFKLVVITRTRVHHSKPSPIRLLSRISSPCLSTKKPVVLFVQTCRRSNPTLNPDHHSKLMLGSRASIMSSIKELISTYGFRIQNWKS